MENKELKLGKGLIYHIRESNKPRDSKGRYCKKQELTKEEILKIWSRPLQPINNTILVGMNMYNKLLELGIKNIIPYNKFEE